MCQLEDGANALAPVARFESYDVDFIGVVPVHTEDLGAAVNVQDLSASRGALHNAKFIDLQLTGLDPFVPVNEDNIRAVLIQQAERNITQLPRFLHTSERNFHGDPQRFLR